MPKIVNIWTRQTSTASHIGCKRMSSSPTCRHASQLLGLDWVASAMGGLSQGAEHSSKHVHVHMQSNVQHVQWHWRP
eukprot:365817-Chlamydomonas_euryale.AAC.9